jgi:hypothetical protein
VCSANVRNEPPYDPPMPTKPRVYVLSGSVPPARVAASVALAVLGEMLSEEERGGGPGTAFRYSALLEARDRVARAEAEYADGTVRG